MVDTARKILRNGRVLLRSFGERGIEKNFQKIDHFRCGPNSTLSDFVLMRGYKTLMEELENEQNADVRHLIFNDIMGIETELKKRNLLNEDRSL